MRVDCPRGHEVKENNVQLEFGLEDLTVRIFCPACQEWYEFMILYQGKKVGKMTP